PTGLLESVHRAGRRLVRELPDSVGDPAPSRGAVTIAGGHELVGSGGAFLERLVAIALEHQLRRPPNVDLRDHALKLHIYGQRTFKTGDHRPSGSLRCNRLISWAAEGRGGRSQKQSLNPVHYCCF